MPRKKKVEEVVLEQPKKTRKKKVESTDVNTTKGKQLRKKKPKYEADDGPLTETQLAQLPSRPLVDFEIDWDKIAANVQEAADMIKNKR